MRRDLGYLLVGLLLTSCGGASGASATADDATAKRMCAAVQRDDGSGGDEYLRLTSWSLASKDEVSSEFDRADLTVLRSDDLAVCHFDVNQNAPQASPRMATVIAAVDRRGNSTWVGGEPAAEPQGS